MAKRKKGKRMKTRAKPTKVWMPPPGSCGSYGNVSPRPAPSISRERARVTATLRGLELPAPFSLATVAAAARETYKKRPKQMRRLADKVRRIQGRDD